MSTAPRYDLYSHDFRRSTPETYARMRSETPMHRQPGLDGETPIWFVTRYDDVVALLADNEGFVLGPALALTPEELAAQEEDVPIAMDPRREREPPLEGRRRPSPAPPARDEGVHAADRRGPPPANREDRR